MIKTYFSTSRLAQHYGVHPQTIRRWQRIGLIAEHHRTPGNHRRFETPRPPEGEVVGYVRVSSHDQKSDLAVQASALAVKAIAAGIEVARTIQDIGSGMNYNKRGLKQLLEQIMNGQIGRLVLTHKDRLLRFGAELVFSLCAVKNVEVVIINQGDEPSFEEELAKDVLEIITVFSARLYGSRSHKNKQLMTKLQNAVADV